MYKKLITFFLALPIICYAQNTELLGKPNFWPNNNLPKSSNSLLKPNLENQIILQTILYDNEKISLAGIKKTDIDFFANYYLSEVKKILENKKISGVLTILVNVSSHKEENFSKTNCEKNPTECSLTSVNFIFDPDMKKEDTDFLYNYLNKKGIENNMEILINNFDFPDIAEILIEIDINHEPLKQKLKNVLPEEPKQQKLKNYDRNLI
jgi:hypothetical protein